MHFRKKDVTTELTDILKFSKTVVPNFYSFVLSRIPILSEKKLQHRRLMKTNVDLNLNQKSIKISALNKPHEPREKKFIQIISNKKFHAHLKFNHHERIHEAANVINYFPRISKLHTLLFTLLKVIIHTALFLQIYFWVRKVREASACS